MLRPRPQPIGRLGAFTQGDGVTFRVWAPERAQVEVVLVGPKGEPRASVPMRKDEHGIFHAHVPGLAEGSLYKLRVDGEGPFPDMWSRAQPFGVHGPSEVVADGYDWRDTLYPGLGADKLVLYELHVGTATDEGTFDALIPKLPELAAMGVTAIELMPVASFPGDRNWGYDGVSLFAPQAQYGGPLGLRRLVDAAHQAGLGVVLDVVYNHLGPDGNYLRCYSPRYFTSRHHTPWGDALNFDGDDAEPVRELVLQNAEMWIRDYRVDGLRLDAVHAIVDDRRPHLLAELSVRAHAAAQGRRIVLIAEDERNEPSLLRPIDRGGMGLDCTWADDLHHQLRRAFAGDTEGYYADYTGSAADLARTLSQGWFYEGQHSIFRNAPRGKPGFELQPWQLIHCIQNHDQVGNRALGDRLGHSVTPAAFRAMSALLLLSPYTPLLFMGQEWNAKSPFLFFTDHHEELGQRVTEGRRREFERFESFQRQSVPDPQAHHTFHRSRLDWSERELPDHAGVLRLYRELLRLRATDPRLLDRRRESFRAEAIGEKAVLLERSAEGTLLQLVLCIAGVTHFTPAPGARLWLWTDEARFGGEGRRPGSEGGAFELTGPCAYLFDRPPLVA